MLYLDTLASYPLLPEVQKALTEAFATHYANPSASHNLAELAKLKIEEVREQLADSIGALPSEIVFTSGATESNNLLLKSAVEPLLRQGKTPHIITSKIEHKCILAICSYLAKLGCEITYLAPDDEGIVSAASLEASVKENTTIVTLMHVNNELGTINPIQEYGQLCFERGVQFHTDAAQSYQKVPIDVDEDNIDFLSISAHKIGGPKGIGAAYIRNLRNLEVEPLVHGAGQEFGVRGGTLAAPLIMAFGEAIKCFSEYYNQQLFAKTKQLLLNELRKAKIDFAVNGGAQTLDSSVSLTFKNIDVDGLMRTTAEQYCLSQSSACSAGSIEPSHVLMALGFNRNQAANTLRISFPFSITHADIRELVADIKRFLAA